MVLVSPFQPRKTLALQTWLQKLLSSLSVFISHVHKCSEVVVSSLGCCFDCTEDRLFQIMTSNYCGNLFIVIIFASFLSKVPFSHRELW